MRILLDESLPRPLARLLPEHDVRTVAAMGWAGKRNGELLQLAAADFDALLTADQNLEHQQKLGAPPIAAIVLIAPTNRIDSLRLLIPTLLQTLQTLAPRQLVRVGVNACVQRRRSRSADWLWNRIPEKGMVFDTADDQAVSSLRARNWRTRSVASFVGKMVFRTRARVSGSLAKNRS